MRLLSILAMTFLAIATPTMADPTSGRPQQAGPPAGYDPAAAHSEGYVDVGPLALRLKQRYADRLAGTFVEPERNRLVLRLTGAAAVPQESHWIEGQQIDVVFVTGALHTFADLMTVMERDNSTIERLLPTAHSRYVDERTGEIVIGVDPGHAGTDEAQLATALGVPVRIEVEERAILNVDAALAPGRTN